MTASEFSAYAQGRNYHCVGSAAYGVHNGYPFSAAFRVGGTGSILLSFTVAGNVPNKLLRGLRKQLPRGCVLQPTAQVGLVTILCKGKDTPLTGQLEAALDAAVQSFREGMLGVSDTCPVCNGTGCDALALLGGYVPVHEHCVRNQTQSAIAKAQHNEAAGNYLTGFIGALLGGLVGAIPNVLAAVLLERVFSLLYALIPIAAYQGYKLFNGKLNKAAFISTLVSSVINLFSVEFLTLYVIASMAYEDLLTPGFAVELFVTFLLNGNLTADLAQSALFLALGLWFSWSIITNTSSHMVRSAAAVQSTLQPYRPEGGTVQAPAAGTSASAPAPSPASSASYKGPELDEH